MIVNVSEPVKHGIDGGSLAVVILALLNYAPAISAALSCIWLVIRIYETHTVQKLIAKFKKR